MIRLHTSLLRLSIVAAGLALALESAPAQAQAPDCAAAVTNIVKTLRLNPKVVSVRDIHLACLRTGNKPALASRNLLQHFVTTAKITPGPVSPANCGDAVLFATATAGMPEAAAPMQAIGQACQATKGRAALASRDLAHRFVVANKLDQAKPADAKVANTCPGRIKAISAALKLNPKFANDADIATACKKGNGRPVLTMRNYLDRFVVTAKIAPSVLRPEGKPGQQAAGCPDAVTQVMKTLAINPKIANPKNLATACQRAKDRPALASANFLDYFVKQGKITPDKPKPAPAAFAKSCPGRLMAVSKTLRINPKFANPKDVQTACARAKGKPALASRNFLGRFVTAAKLK